MATARPFQHNLAAAETTNATTTPAVKNGLDVAYLANEQHFLIWYANAQHATAGALDYRLRDVTGGTTLANPIHIQNGATDYLTLGGFAMFTAPASSGTRRFETDYRVTDAAGSAKTKNAHLFALKRHANEEYVENLAQQAVPVSGTDNAYHSVLSLTTSKPAGTYLLLMYCELQCLDFIGYAARINIGGTGYSVFDSHRPVPSNSWKPYYGGRVVSLTGAAQTYDLEVRSDDSNNAVQVRNRRILLLAGEGFSQFFAANLDARQTTTSASYAGNNHINLTQATASGDHLVLALGMADTNTANAQVGVQLLEDTVLKAETLESPVFNTPGGAPAMTFCAAYKTTLPVTSGGGAFSSAFSSAFQIGEGASATHIWQEQYKSNGTATMGLAYGVIFVGQLQAIYDESLTEPVGVADTLASTLTGTSALAQSFGVNDTVAGNLQMLCSLAQTFGCTDAQLGILAMAANLAEAMGVTEFSGSPSAFTLSVAEPYLVSDTYNLAGSETYQVAITQGFVINEILLGPVIFGPTSLEQVLFVSDQYRLIDLDVLLALNQPIQVQDRYTAFYQDWQPIEDGRLAALDLWTEVGDRRPGNSFELSFSDVLVVNDQYGTPSAYTLSLGDSIGVLDVQRGNIVFTSTLAEPMAVGAAHDGDQTLVTRADAIAVADAYAVTLGAFGGLSDAITVGDQALPGGTLYEATITETIGVVDVYGTPTVYQVTFSDVLTIGNVYASSLAMTAALADALAVGNTSLSPTVYQVTLSESFTIVDGYTTVIGANAFLYPNGDTLIFPGSGDDFLYPP